jgi:hypothetical protein
MIGGANRFLSMAHRFAQARREVRRVEEEYNKRVVQQSTSYSIIMKFTLAILALIAPAMAVAPGGACNGNGVSDLRFHATSRQS